VSVVMFTTPNYNIHNCSFEKEIVKLEKNHDLILLTQFIAKTNSRVKYRNPKLWKCVHTYMHARTHTHTYTHTQIYKFSKI